MNKTFAFRLFTQLTILGYALYAQWDPYLLFFVYITELFILGILGIIQSIRFGGFNTIPMALFGFSVTSGGLTIMLLFAMGNILKPFGISPDTSEHFFHLLALSLSTTWITLILSTVQISIKEFRMTPVENFDPFFYPLRPLVRIIPLVFTVFISGFLSFLFGPTMILIGMTLTNLCVDFFLRDTHVDIKTKKPA